MRIILFAVTLFWSSCLFAAPVRIWKTIDLDIGIFKDTDAVKQTLDIFNDTTSEVTCTKIDKDCSCTDAILSESSIQPGKKCSCSITIKALFVPNSQNFNSGLIINTTNGCICVNIHGRKQFGYSLDNYTMEFVTPPDVDAPVQLSKRVVVDSDKPIPNDLYLFPAVPGITVVADGDKSICFVLSQPLLYSQSDDTLLMTLKSSKWPESYGIPININIKSKKSVQYKPENISVGFIQPHEHVQSSVTVSSAKLGDNFQVLSAVPRSSQLRATVSDLTHGRYLIQIEGDYDHPSGKPFTEYIDVYNNAEPHLLLQVEGMISAAEGSCCTVRKNP